MVLKVQVVKLRLLAPVVLVQSELVLLAQAPQAPRLPLAAELLPEEVAAVVVERLPVVQPGD